MYIAANITIQNKYKLLTSPDQLIEKKMNYISGKWMEMKTIIVSEVRQMLRLLSCVYISV